MVFYCSNVCMVFVDSNVCWLHPINAGIVVSGDSVTLEWQVTGNRADAVTSCRLDGGNAVSCMLYYILLPLACTLHPLACTLHPLACTHHPLACTLHPLACTLHPLACTHACMHACSKCGSHITGRERTLFHCRWVDELYL